MHALTCTSPTVQPLPPPLPPHRKHTHHNTTPPSPSPPSTTYILTCDCGLDTSLTCASGMDRADTVSATPSLSFGRVELKEWAEATDTVPVNPGSAIAGAVGALEDGRRRAALAARPIAACWSPVEDRNPGAGRGKACWCEGWLRGGGGGGARHVTRVLFRVREERGPRSFSIHSNPCMYAKRWASRRGDPGEGWQIRAPGTTAIATAIKKNVQVSAQAQAPATGTRNRHVTTHLALCAQHPLWVQREHQYHQLSPVEDLHSQHERGRECNSRQRRYMHRAHITQFVSRMSGMHDGTPLTRQPC